MDAEVSKALQVTWGMLECRETGDRHGNRKRKAHTHRGRQIQRQREGGGERLAKGNNAERN